MNTPEPDINDVPDDGTSDPFEVVAQLEDDLGYQLCPLEGDKQCPAS